MYVLYIYFFYHYFERLSRAFEVTLKIKLLSLARVCHYVIFSNVTIISLKKVLICYFVGSADRDTFFFFLYFWRVYKTHIIINFVLFSMKKKYTHGHWYPDKPVSRLPIQPEPISRFILLLLLRAYPRDDRDVYNQ